MIDRISGKKNLQQHCKSVLHLTKLQKSVLHLTYFKKRSPPKSRKDDNLNGKNVTRKRKKGEEEIY